jgi:hypothetical protein
LFYELPFHRHEDAVNKLIIPSVIGLGEHDVTDSVNIVVAIVRSVDSESILPYQPVVLPDIDGLAIAYLPTTASFNSSNSLMYTLPSIAGLITLMCLKNIRMRIVFGFDALTQERVRVSFESPYLFS